MDPILIFGICILKIIYTGKIFVNFYWGEVGYHDHGAMKAQGSQDSRLDLVDAVQKRDIQHIIYIYILLYYINSVLSFPLSKLCL